MKKRKSMIGFLTAIVAVLSLGIAYAAVSGVNLSITGSAKSKKADYSVEFISSEAGAKVGNGTVTTSLDETDKTKATIAVTDLQYKGDYVTAVYTIKNKSESLSAQLSEPTVSIADEGLDFDDDDGGFAVTTAYGKTTLNPGEETTLTVVVSAKDDFSEVVEKTITIRLTAEPTTATQDAGAGTGTDSGDGPSLDDVDDSI